MPIPMLKVYGERNTGTNYLAKLIGLNFNVRQLPGVVPRYIMALQRISPGRELVRDAYFGLTFGRNLGWKHMCVKPPTSLRKYPLASKVAAFITLSKNPYSWLLSLFKRPYQQVKKDLDFETFLSLPWRPLGRDNVIGDLASPVLLWNIKNRSYLQLSEAFPAYNMTYEALLRAPKHQLGLVSRRMSIELRTTEFIDYTESTKDSHRNAAYYLDYYLNERWRDEMSPRAIGLINDHVDDNLMQRFGYERLACS